MSADARLATYLNDHLAGSVAAIEMGERMRDAEPASPKDAALAADLARLVGEIREDQAILRDLIDRIGGGESAAKGAVAWIAEKLGRVKLGGDAATPSAALGRFEALEVLLLGVRGKLALWDALATVRGDDPRFAHLNFAELRRRARDQMDCIDRHRLAAARAAFA